MPRRLVLAGISGACGVALLIAGTFLGWITSGGQARNLYELTGLADHFGFLDNGAARLVPPLISLLGPACLVPVILALLRLRRTAAVLALLIGAVCLVASALILVLLAGKGGLGLALDPTGPIAVLVGAVLVITSGVLLLIAAPKHHVPATSWAQ